MVDLSDVFGIKVIYEPWEGTDSIPYFLNEAYDFRKVIMDGTPCLFAEPRSQAPEIQSLIKHFAAIYSTAALPVVLKINVVSGEYRKALMEARVPFVASSQAYLPFMGTVLQKQLYSEPKPREKLMPSSQMLLFAYLYQDRGEMYTSPMAEKIGFSAMQITRAIRQLCSLNLIEVSKEGVQVVVKGKANHRALFENAATYLLDPVRDIFYVPRDERISHLPYAGISALSEMSMLAAPEPQTYAYYSKTNKLHGERGLTDSEKQVRVERWKYDPSSLSEKDNIADPLSVIASLKDERDDARVEQAIEDVLKKLWR